MTRPLVLLSTISSWLLGVTMAYGTGFGFNWTSFTLGLSSTLLVSASIHLINEYADYHTDALTQRTAYSGGSGVLPSGLVPRIWAMYFALFTAGIGFFIQFVAVNSGYHPLQAIYIIAIGTIGGWGYSLPPRLAWIGLGEIWNALLGAWLLPFFGFVQISKTTDSWALWTLLPVTFLAFNNLLAVTWPDREADQIVGKKTLATRLDPRILKMFHEICTVLSLIILHIIELPPLVYKLSIIAYPLMVLGWYTYTNKEISYETIFSLHLLIIAQVISWIIVGFKMI